MTQLETRKTPAREPRHDVARNVETVKAIYAAFGRGDVAAILAVTSPDVEWEIDAGSHGIPYLQPGRGHVAVTGFFGALGGTLEMLDFGVHAVMGDGEWVVGLVRVEARVRATGKTFREAYEPHVWRFDASGKVIAMRHGADTHRHLAAMA